MTTHPLRRACCALLAGLPLLATPAELDVLEEVRVTGEQPGPAMWRVSKDGHTLWIMGTFHPLPAGMTWRSRQAEEVIGRSGAILAPSTNTVGVSSAWDVVRNLRGILRLRFNADGATLREVLPPTLYDRWHAAHRRWFGKDPEAKERARPIYAAQLLFAQAVRKSGLVQGPQIWNRVGELAKQHKVPIRRRQFRVEVDKLKPLIKDLSNLSRDTEMACLTQALDYIDEELPKMRRRAEAWAVGDVAMLRALPREKNLNSCQDAATQLPSVNRLLEDQRAEVERDWSGIIDWMLLAHETSFTALPVDDLLQPDGLLGRLRARGYTVEEPQ